MLTRIWVLFLAVVLSGCSNGGLITEEEQDMLDEAQVVAELTLDLRGAGVVENELMEEFYTRKTLDSEKTTGWFDYYDEPYMQRIYEKTGPVEEYQFLSGIVSKERHGSSTLGYCRGYKVSMTYEVTGTDAKVKEYFDLFRPVAELNETDSRGYNCADSWRLINDDFVITEHRQS